VSLNRKCLAVLAATGLASAAYAATQIAVQTPIAVSDVDTPDIKTSGPITVITRIPATRPTSRRT
jgi:hypothetical protein